MKNTNVLVKAEAAQNELEVRFEQLTKMFKKEGIEFEGSTEENEYMVAHIVAGDYTADVKVELNNDNYIFKTNSYTEMTTLEGIKELVEMLSK